MGRPANGNSHSGSQPTCQSSKKKTQINVKHTAEGIGHDRLPVVLGARGLKDRTWKAWDWQYAPHHYFLVLEEG
jgi:hypothetical protein